MKNYINQLQNGDRKTQLITFGVLMVAMTILLFFMHNAGVIHFDKY